MDFNRIIHRSFRLLVCSYISTNHWGICCWDPPWSFVNRFLFYLMFYCSYILYTRYFSFLNWTWNFLLCKYTSGVPSNIAFWWINNEGYWFIDHLYRKKWISIPQTDINLILLFLLQRYKQQIAMFGSLPFGEAIMLLVIMNAGRSNKDATMLEYFGAPDQTQAGWNEQGSIYECNSCTCTDNELHRRWHPRSFQSCS